MATDTIFTPSFGNQPTFLVGRENVISGFEKSLNSALGSRERATILLGQRGSGKTVLLLKFASFAEKSGFVACSPTIVADGMLDRIIEKILNNENYKKHKHKHKLAGGSLGAFGFSAGINLQKDANNANSFQQKLFDLTTEINNQGKGLLILVDELQANSVEIKQLIIGYQELVGEGLNVSLVMAGLPGAVSATLNDKVLTFLNRANKITLDPLRKSDISAYYTTSFEKLGMSISGEQIEIAAEASKGSPYMMQLIGHNIVVGAQNSNVTNDTLTRAIKLAEQDYINDICKTTINALSEKDVDFLRAMSDDEGISNLSDIASRMGVTSDYAQKYRRRLIDAGVIAVSGRGKVTYDVPYLKDYLKSGFDW